MLKINSDSALDRFRRRIGQSLGILRPNLEPEQAQRVSLLNRLFLAEIPLLLLVAGVVENRSGGRYLATVGIFLLGGALAYLLNRMGQVRPALWGNTLAALVAWGFYILTTPHSDPQLFYINLRASFVVLAIPITISGIIGGARLALLFSLLAGIELAGLAPFNLSNFRGPGQGDFLFYTITVVTPIGFVFVSAGLAGTFERHIFGLLDQVSRHNLGLRQSLQERQRRRQAFEQIRYRLAEITERLRQNLEEQLDALRNQDANLTELTSTVGDVNQLARRIEHLAGQAEQQAHLSLGVARRGSEAAQTNAATYQRLQENLGLVSKSIELLLRETGQVDRIAGAVGEIAEENNLLALNASIEAVGPRQFKRRFASVATEVQRLALRSREAAEQVQSVVAQLQESVNRLAAMSQDTQLAADNFSSNSHSSTLIIEQMSSYVETCAENSQRILANVQTQQVTVNNTLPSLPPMVQNSQELLQTNQQLLETIDQLHQFLQELPNLREPAPAPDLLTPTPPEDEDAAEDWEWERPGPAFWSKEQSWGDRWQRLAMPYARLTEREQRRARTLNQLCLALGTFFLIFGLLRQSQDWSRPTGLPLLAVVVVLGLVYAFSKSGYYDLAVPFFVGMPVAVGWVYFWSLPLGFERQDFVRTTSALLTLPIIVAALVGWSRTIQWVSGVTLVSVLIMGWLAAPAFILQDFLLTILTPVLLTCSLGLLSGFLYRRLTSLLEQYEKQNQLLDQDNQSLARQEYQAHSLNRRLAELNEYLQPRYYRQTEISYRQEALIREASLRFVGLERETRRLSKATQDISQTTREGLQRAEQGVGDVQAGLRLIEDFENRVEQIALNNQELRRQAEEISQIFGLINEVAEEIELLALNATVEAAQARENGRRFSAVAGEVQQLAGRARQTTSTVQGVIGRVQAAVGQSVELTDSARHEVKLLTEVAFTTSSAIEDTIRTVGNTSNLLNLLESHIEQQQNRLSEVLQYLRAAAQIANRLPQPATQSELALAALQETSNQLAALLEAPADPAAESQPALATQ